MAKPIIVILFPIALALASRAEDWPQWRGSGRDGVWHERGIRKTFPAGGLPVRWRAAVGYGFSSPVVAKGRVFVTDALLDRPKVRGRVLCFEEITGELLWTFSGKRIIRRGLLLPARNRARTEHRSSRMGEFIPPVRKLITFIVLRLLPENWSGKGIRRRITRLRIQQPSAPRLWLTGTG